MTTVTISLPDQIAKKLDEETHKGGFATRSEFVRTLLRERFSGEAEATLQEFKVKPLQEIRNAFEKTGKYNKKFIDSLIRGLSETSVYANKTSKK